MYSKFLKWWDEKFGDWKLVGSVRFELGYPSKKEVISLIFEKSKKGNRRFQIIAGPNATRNKDWLLLSAYHEGIIWTKGGALPFQIEEPVVNPDEVDWGSFTQDFTPSDEGTKARNQR